MDAGCLVHQLTDEERRFFQEQGYLIVENALDEAIRNRLIAIVDRIESRERKPENQGKLLSVTDVIQEDTDLVNLIDWPVTFPKVWGILGWNICLYHSHVDVTPPENAQAQNWSVAWHQDSMRVNDEIESDPRPRLSVKVGYYLTDVSRPECGNTLIVPGSHLENSLDCPQDGQSNPAGAVPICAPAGSAVIIDRRIWHSRSPNHSRITRKVIWYGYSYRWLKPKDEMTVKHLYSGLDPIRRQILGDSVSANGVYDPTGEDVPLRGWLEEHCPDAACHSPHGQPQSRPPAIGRGTNSGRN